MNLVRWCFFLAALLSLVGCSSGPVAVPGISLFAPSATLPPPQVGVTSAPDAQAAVDQFLSALKRNDFGAMYAMLSSDSQAALAQDAFAARYNEALNTMGAATLDYQVMSQLLSPEAAQVGFRIAYHTALVGDLEREMVARLKLEQGRWRLQWDEGLILPELAGGNVLKMDYQVPARGNIYDRDEAPIAIQTDAYALGVQPGGMTGNSEFTIVAQLSQLCNRTPESIRAAYAGAAPEWYVAICEASVEEARGIVDLNQPGLVVTPYNSRFYVGQGIAPQVVGYASLIHKEEIDQYRRQGYRGDEKVGQSGIEKSMEPYLSGKHGGSLYVVDPNGQIVTRLATAEPQPADSVYLTIDANLQRWTQNAFGTFQGAAVVLERDTGRVLAMVSSPRYDQNLFDANNYNSASLLGNVVNDPNQPLVNRAAQGSYPLGSAFKPITMAAGLESGLYLPITTYDCTYDFTELQQYGGPVLHDWTWEHCQERQQAGNACDTSDSQPSGLLTLQEGLMRSCNPFFWHIGLDLFNTDRAADIANMARAFGLGAATGINAIAEATGNVSVPAQPIDATNQAIGQGDLQVTPLQVARFVAAIGNGGTLYRPQLIEKIQPVNGPAINTFKPEAAGTLPLRKDNLEAIQQAMGMVIDNPRGTAHFSLLGMAFPAAGKTGTAQSGSGLPHAWFIGYTENAANTGVPDIAVAVIVENAGEGADLAAPIFRSILEAYYYGSWQSHPRYAAGYGEPTYTPTPFGANPTKTPKPPRGAKPTPSGP